MQHELAPSSNNPPSHRSSPQPVSLRAFQINVPSCSTTGSVLLFLRLCFRILFAQQAVTSIQWPTSTASSWLRPHQRTDPARFVIKLPWRLSPPTAPRSPRNRGLAKHGKAVLRAIATFHPCSPTVSPRLGTPLTLFVTENLPQDTCSVVVLSQRHMLRRASFPGAMGVVSGEQCRPLRSGLPEEEPLHTLLWISAASHPIMWNYSVYFVHYTSPNPEDRPASGARAVEKGLGFPPRTRLLGHCSLDPLESTARFRATHLVDLLPREGRSPNGWPRCWSGYTRGKPAPHLPDARSPSQARDANVSTCTPPSM